MVTRQRSAPDKRKESAEEAKLREAVLSEVLDIKPAESWQDIAGLSGAKQVQNMHTLDTIRASLHIRHCMMMLSIAGYCMSKRD